MHEAVYPLPVLIPAGEKPFDRFWKLFKLVRLDDGPDDLAHPDVYRRGVYLFILRVHDLHGRVDEQNGAKRRESVLIRDTRPVGDEKVGLKNGAVGRKVRLYFNIAVGGVFCLKLLHIRLLETNLLRVRAHGDLVPAPFQRVEYLLKATIHNVVLLP